MHLKYCLKLELKFVIDYEQKKNYIENLYFMKKCLRIVPVFTSLKLDFKLLTVLRGSE